VLIVVSGNAARAQSSLTLSFVSVSPGGIANFKLTLQSPPGSQPAGLQWKLYYPVASIVSISIAPGPAVTSVNKSIICSASPDGTTCLAVGMNNSGIYSGTVATVSVTLPTPTTVWSIGVKEVLGVSPRAIQVSIDSLCGPT